MRSPPYAFTLFLVNCLSTPRIYFEEQQTIKVISRCRLVLPCFEMVFLFLERKTLTGKEDCRNLYFASARYSSFEKKKKNDDKEEKTDYLYLLIKF